MHHSRSPNNRVLSGVSIKMQISVFYRLLELTSTRKLVDEIRPSAFPGAGLANSTPSAPPGQWWWPCRSTAFTSAFCARRQTDGQYTARETSDFVPVRSTIHSRRRSRLPGHHFSERSTRSSINHRRGTARPFTRKLGIVALAARRHSSPVNMQTPLSQCSKVLLAGSRNSAWARS